MTSKLELLKKLRKLDEVLLMELLEITSEELVDAFLDKIDDKLTYIYDQLEEQPDD
jgi:hypothetical protein